jgi:hypothetical protein
MKVNCLLKTTSNYQQMNYFYAWILFIFRAVNGVQLSKENHFVKVKWFDSFAINRDSRDVESSLPATSILSVKKITVKTKIIAKLDSKCLRPIPLYLLNTLTRERGWERERERGERDGYTQKTKSVSSIFLILFKTLHFWKTFKKPFVTCGEWRVGWTRQTFW